MGKVEDNKKLKRESLLNSALQLFNENGFQQTSISDISKKAGVAKGTFYLYFSDKFDLRNKLISHQASRIFMNAYKALDTEAIPEFEDQMIFLIDHILNQFAANPQIMYFISKHLSWAVFTDALKQTASPSRFEDPGASIAFRDLVQSLETKYHNPELMVYMILELSASASYNVILYGQPVTLEELKPELFDTVRFLVHRQEKSDLPANEEVSLKRETGDTI